MIYIILYIIICVLLSLYAILMVILDQDSSRMKEKFSTIALAIVFWPLVLLVITILGLSFIISIIIYSNRY